MLRSDPMRTSLRVPAAGDSTPLLQHRGSSYSPYKKLPWYRRPRFYLSLIRRGLGELLGTALFVFVSIAASSSVIEDERYGYLVTSSAASVVALASGLSYAGLMAALTPVSGGHMNPSVTLGVFISGGINVVAALVYICSQIVGGIVGAACVLAYDSDYGSNSSNYSVGSTVDYGLTYLHGNITPLQGIAVEMVLTLMVVMVFVHTTMEGEEGSQNKGQSNARSVIAPLVCGFTLAAAVMSSYSITGGSFNPARSFGPAVVGSSSERWSYHYVYWVGPLVGSLLTGLFYRLVLSSNPLLPLTEDDSPKITKSNSRVH